MPVRANAGPRRVVVIADDPLARSGLALLMAGDDRLAVVDQVAPRDDLAGALAAVSAEVGVWDLGVGGRGLERAAAVSSTVPLVCLAPDAERSAELLALGARALLPRDVDAARLCATVIAVIEGLLVLDEHLASELLDERRASSLSPVENLTPRELEVLELVAEGLSNKLIAARLGISEHTAKFHVNAVMTKLGAQSRTEAVVRAARLGLLSL